MRRQSLIPSDGRVIKWDPNDDHIPADPRDEARTDSLAEFFRYLAAAERSGRRSYQVAFNGEPSPQVFEKFARGVWSVLDGRRMTYLLVEEYADCCPGAGPLNPARDVFHRRLWIQGRKYGLVILTTSQRPQLVSKDSLSQAGQMWVSNVDPDAADRLGKVLGVHWQALTELDVGEFYRRVKPKPAEKLRIFTPN